MPSNDTENIYSTEYGGQGEPIPATKISYDGTGTSIEATNVQNAITEVDTDLQSTMSDVSDIEAAINDGYIFMGYSHVDAVSDGTKTYSQLLTDVIDNFIDFIANLDDDEYAVIERIQSGVRLIPLTKSMYNNQSTWSNITFEGSALITNESVMRIFIANPKPSTDTASVCLVSDFKSNGENLYATNYGAITAVEDTTLTLVVSVYKKV